MRVGSNILGYTYFNDARYESDAPTQADASAMQWTLQGNQRKHLKPRNTEESQRIINKFLSDDYRGWY